MGAFFHSFFTEFAYGRDKQKVDYPCSDKMLFAAFSGTPDQLHHTFYPNTNCSNNTVMGVGMQSVE